MVCVFLPDSGLVYYETGPRTVIRNKQFQKRWILCGYVRIIYFYINCYIPQTFISIWSTEPGDSVNEVETT